MKDMGDEYGKERDLYERDLNGQYEEEKASDKHDANEQYNKTEGAENKDMHKKKNRKRNSVSKFRSCLTFVQHLLLAAAAAALLFMVTGSMVVINGKSYILDASDRETPYEDSELFDMLYGEAVADIVRFGVIRSQLETNGRFDGKRIIDVTAYNYRDTGIPEKYVTARYYLEDLLKWQKYGLSYSTEYMKLSELDAFLSDKTMMTTIDPDSKYYNTSDASYMKSNIGNYTFVDDVSANMLPTDDYGGYYEEYDGYYDEYAEEKIEVNVLVNRYKTVEGKNIEAYTADLPSYNELCNNVVTAMESLSYNYEEYLKFKEYYDGSNTNLRYCIEKTVDGNTEYFTNMEDLISISELQEQLGYEYKSMTDFFRERLDGRLDIDNGRYLYYSPSDMVYESNSKIAESTIGAIVRKYDYAYPEDIRIWIGVDAAYPVNDAFMQGKAGYQNYLPYFWQWGVLAVFALILYFVLFGYLTITAGREEDEAGNIVIGLTEFDKVPTEIAAIALVSVAALLGCIVNCCYELYLVYEGYIHKLYLNNTNILIICVVAVVFLLDAITSFFYYSFIRRIKAKGLWRNSYTRRIIKKCHKLILETYDNSSIVIRTWGPYIIFFIFNLLMALTGVLGIVIAIVIDLAVGVMLYRDAKERQDIVSGIRKISEGDFAYQVERDKMHGENLTLAESVNSIGNGIKNAVEISMKDERMKTELITNVSHDIKTPLTSIINYVDLIKREDIDNERVRGYIKVLDEKSQRLKQLIDDLVEASKISSGNINLHFEKINLTELLNQTIGEFSEKFEQKGLTIVMNGNASNVIIEADSRSIWRVIENLFNNVYKYALERTRVYVSLNHLVRDGKPILEQVELTIRNISASELNCNPEELTERFIRGDEARTTEGSGLGLSIAKNLTEAQNGTFEIQLDGDLFKVILTFPVMPA